MNRVPISTCPICNAMFKSLDSQVLYHLNTLNTQVPINYAVCLDCGFVFQADPLCWEGLREYYQSSPRFRSATNDAIDRELCKDQLHFIEKVVKVGKCRALDIGADMGKMLDLLKDKYSCETAYMEENEAACEYLRGHRRHEEVSDLDEAGSYDLCILSQVLEHIVHPVSFLEKIRRHLNQDGSLFIEVPNHSFWDEKDYGFSFEHVNYFSPATLTRTLYQAGFIVTSLAITSHKRYFSGNVRIIRVIATPMPSMVRTQLVEVIKEHEKREFSSRFRAAEELANKLSKNGQAGLALYGAAELANLFFSSSTIGSHNIAAVFDTDQKKHGQDFHGFTISGADAQSTEKVKAVLVLSSAEKTIRDHLLKNGFNGEIIAWSELKHSDE